MVINLDWGMVIQQLLNQEKRSQRKELMQVINWVQPMWITWILLSLERKLEMELQDIMLKHFIQVQLK